jgi:hypothetical protein
MDHINLTLYEFSILTFLDYSEVPLFQEFTLMVRRMTVQNLIDHSHGICPERSEIYVACILA